MLDELVGTFDRILAKALPQQTLLQRAAVDASTRSEIVPQLVDLGWTSIALSSASGGFDLGVGALTAFGTVAGRRLMPHAERDVALVAAPALDLVSSLTRVHLSDVLNGAPVATRVLPFPESVIADSNGNLALEGMPVLWPDGAEVLVLACPDRLFVIEDTDRIRRVAFRCVDPGQQVVRVHARLQIPPTHCVTGPEAAHLWARWNAVAFADLAGSALAACELAVAHARTREQFGRPLAEFQAVRHRLADIASTATLAESSAARVAMLLDVGGTGASEVLSRLRAAVPALARRSCEDAIQVHGGLGFTWEYGLHLYYRRVLLLQAWLGGPTAAAEVAGRQAMDGRDEVQ